jgi:hypothetical protein
MIISWPCSTRNAAWKTNKKNKKKMMMPLIHTQPPAGQPRRRDQEIRNNCESPLLSGNGLLLTGVPDEVHIAGYRRLSFNIAYAAENRSHAFLKKAIEGYHAEIRMGELAQQRGQSDSVKKFGQVLSDDHSAANQKAMQAAKSMDGACAWWP